MRHRNTPSSPIRPNGQRTLLLAFSFSLLVSASTAVQAQAVPGYNAPPPPPLSNSAPHGGTSRQGVYVLPGTMTRDAQPRELPSLPRAEPPPPPPSRSAPLPSPRRLSDMDSGQTATSNHHAGTPQNLRYIRRPSPTPRTHYPTPQQQPASPMVRQAVPLQPQAPVATTPAPELPFGQHSAPMEPQVTVERAIPIEPQWQAVTPAPASPQQVDTVAQDGFLAEFNALTATASPDIPEETPTIVDIAPPAIIPSQPLSEESRRIIASTPSGIDTQRVRSPEPVIIRRTDPNAGVIPKVDVRAHEELGLKIEIRRPDESIQHYLEQGYDNLLNKRYAIAAGYYQEALRIQRKNEAALFGLATTYHRLHQKDEARQLYIELLEINPTHREGLNNFMALVSGESPADAIEALEQLETENPDFSPIPAQLGTLYNRIGDPRMAARKLARALNLSPDNVSYKYNLAVTLDKLGQAEQASDLYLELIEAHNQGATLPGDVNDLRNRVIFINQKG